MDRWQRYREATEYKGPLGFDWRDKPHRVLLLLVKEAQTLEDRIRDLETQLQIERATGDGLLEENQRLRNRLHAATAPDTSRTG